MDTVGARMVDNVKYTWLCAYAPLNKRGKISLSEIRRLWEELGQCLKGFVDERSVFVWGYEYQGGKCGFLLYYAGHLFPF